MTKKTIVGLLTILLIIAMVSAACTPKNVQSDTGIEIDVVGLYSGTIPSADGPGINVQLILTSDDTFTLVYDYIDTEDGIFSWEGTYSLNGDIVTLEQEFEFFAFPHLYRAGENQLLQLDFEGNEITGDFADMYILIKM